MSTLSSRLNSVSTECKLYLLSGLALHLFEGNHHDRLISLFENQEWIYERIKNGSGSSKEFIDDLSLTWGKVLLPIVQGETKNKPLSDALGICIRLALIRSSLNSRTGMIPPDLIVQAAKTHLWSQQFTLEVIETISSWQQRVSLYLQLLRENCFDKANKKHAVSLALHSVQLADSVYRPFPSDQKYQINWTVALAQVLEYLDEDKRNEILEGSLQKIYDNSYNKASTNVRIVSALIPLLNDNGLNKAIQHALEQIHQIENESEFSYAIVALSPFISKSDLQDFFIKCLEMKISVSRSEAMTSLAAHLTQEQIHNILSVVFKLDDEASITDALGALAPYIQEDLIDTCIRMALSFKENSFQVKLLTSMIPRLEDHNLVRVLEIILITLFKVDNFYRVKGLLIFLMRQSPHLPSNIQADLVEKLLNVILRIKNIPRRIELLVEILPFIDELLQTVDLDLELDKVFAYYPDYWKEDQDCPSELQGVGEDYGRNERLSLLTILLPHISQEKRSQIAAYIFREISALNLDHLRSDRIMALIPHMSKDQLVACVDSAFADDLRREKILSTLAPFLEVNTLKDVISRCTLFLDDEKYQSRAITALEQSVQDKRDKDVERRRSMRELASKTIEDVSHRLRKGTDFYEPKFDQEYLEELTMLNNNPILTAANGFASSLLKRDKQSSKPFQIWVRQQLSEVLFKSTHVERKVILLFIEAISHIMTNQERSNTISSIQDICEDWTWPSYPNVV